MEFKESQKHLKGVKSKRETSERDLFMKKEKLNKTRREKGLLLRFAGDGQNTADLRLRELERRETELVADIDKFSTELNLDREIELEGIKSFLPFTDPTKNISKLDDLYPILLFPLRIETRFKQFDIEGAETQHQLWVRVFPDEIAIDAFEELPSENEVRNLRSYWASMWRAGDVEKDKRAAWRSLVSSHGSGRAYWLVEDRNNENMYKPVNQSEQPKRENTKKINLVISTDDPPEENEKEALKPFWSAMWLAQDDKMKQTEAWDQLVEEVGESRARELRENYIPFNLSDQPEPPLTHDDVEPEVAFIEFPAPDETDTKFQSWTRAPKVNILPERLVLLGFYDDKDKPPLQVIGNPIPSSLATGPDPSAKEGDQFKIAESDREIDGKHYKKGDLIVGKELKWMVEFEEAVVKGMGFKINLEPDQAKTGFHRLFVLGVRLGADKEEGKNLTETLIDHHHHSRKGLGILSQGTPTNNTEKEGSAYSWREDPDDSFDIYFNKETPEDRPGWFEKKDGRWLAEMLGIDKKYLEPVANYYGTDQCEAKAMNVALWPATWGYFMETMMAPVFSDRVIQQTRSFFQRYVSGRGMIPAVRVGKQPYGILPATPFSRMNWLRIRTPVTHNAVTSSFLGGNFSYLQQLYNVLKQIDEEWNELAAKVSHVGKSGDAHQILLDIVGLHPSSVEHYCRYAQSTKQNYNIFNLKGRGESFSELIRSMVFRQKIMKLLSLFGYTAQEDEDMPEILKKFFFSRSDLLKGPLIDDMPLSESDKIRDYAKKDDKNINYIQWLIDAANDSHDTLRKQQGFIDNKPPTALLYLMLQHALDLGYVDAGLRLHVSSGLFNRDQIMAMRQEPAFIHVQDRKIDPGSRWQHLYKPETQITGDESMLVGNYIPTIIKEKEETTTLRHQLKALENLKDVPTARLERVFTEHLDTCSYRLDAWMLGLVNTQLSLMRGIQAGEDVSFDEFGSVFSGQVPDSGSILPRQGLYIGAYGWLEDVRPKNKVLTPGDIDPELEGIFSDPNHPLMKDNTNGGYIHAPSANHAVTAAVLRSGYLANATPSNPTSLAVNLSSERVRLALSMIEGICSGQSLAALLGYQLERGMHDRHDAEVDEFIFDMRKAFPLVSNRMSTTKEEDVDDVQKIEARNVIDGLALIEQIKKSSKQTYPFGREDLPEATHEQEKAIKAINEEVERILDINDAVSDLAVAESVHQVVQGNYDRAAATLDTYSKGNFPPIPDVIKTPRSGVTLTHRIGLQFETGLNPDDPANTTPRAKAEPAINKWLSDILPVMGSIVCMVEFYDHNTNSIRPESISMEELGLLPIDVLYMVQMESEQAMTTLDDAIMLRAIQKFAPRPDVKIGIKYIKPSEDKSKVTLFELEPLLNSLRAIIQRSRPLTAGDVKLAAETSKAGVADVSLNPKRITSVRDALKGLNTELGTFISTILPELDWTVAKSEFGNENLVSSLLNKGILENVESDPDRVRFDVSILDEDKLKSNLKQIEGIQINPILVIWRQILAKYKIIVTKIDIYINDAVTIFKKISKFGLPQTGFGFLLEWKRQQFEQLRKKVDELIARWDNKLTEFDTLITQYNDKPGTAPLDEKIALLQKAELKISTTSKTTLPTTSDGSVDPDAYRDDLINNKRRLFKIKLGGIKNMLASSTLSDLYTNIENVITGISTFDLVAMELEGEKKQLLIFARDIKKAAENLQTDLGRRLKQVADLLPPNDADIDPKEHIKELLEARKELLGEDFRIVPEFGLAEEQADEWTNAYDNREKLLKYQRETLEEEFPVDGWLYGIARVREKMHHVENTIMLVEAFSEKELTLEPVQFPYHQEDYWLALEYPEKKTDGTPFKINEDKLLYTSYYTEAFDKTKRQCGLLIDEWTEVIPTEEETTALTFHYDRPNSEPAQTLLLVTPSEFKQSWQWQDLVDTLHETLDMAKKRAIEPGHIDDTDYARFLPSLVSAVAAFPITPALNLALNNEFHLRSSDENR
jgi:hypothetical protein